MKVYYKNKKGKQRKLYTYHDGYIMMTWYGRWLKLKRRILASFMSNEKLIKLMKSTTHVEDE